MLAFISRLIRETPAGRLLERLNLTAFDELLDIDLETGKFVSRYHADGKFFTPVSQGSFSQLLEYAFAHMVHPEDQNEHRALMNAADMEKRLRESEIPGILNGVIRYLGLDGNWHRMHHLLIGGEAYGLRPHQVYFYLYDIQDIRDRELGQHTEAEEASERMRSMLPQMDSEAVFFSMSEEMMKRQDIRQWCMVAVDVKHYKLFRELNGQEKGERLLIRFGEILHETAERLGGLACYRGQDDFGLLIPFEQKQIDRLFSQLSDEISQLSGTSGFFPVLGICMAEEEEADAMEVFNRAALTAEEIKDDLRYHIRVYDPKVHEQHVEEFRLLAEFQEALETDDIFFHVQPQVDISTDRIVGAESLARWKGKNGTFVSPARFVPILEKYGAVMDLDLRVWEEVCRWLRSLLDRGLRPVPVSVNVSRLNIYTVDVPAILSGLIEKYSLPAELLKVEITESAYVDDSERVRENITQLRKKGFRVMMDDFGSGYSSLNMLRTVSVDVIKLDAQFLRFSIGEEQRGINILESVINMTKSLSTPIIVEGVETRELVQFLRDMGCRYMQGFYYYRPMPVEQFETLLQDPAKMDYRGIIPQQNQQMHTREFLDENLYSDAMLNNILGPVAFYSRRGEDIDIIRFNQQFVELVGLDPKVLEERRVHIQQFFYPEDLNKFYRMLDTAAQDRINGASGMFRIFKPNGTLLWMQLRVYLLRSEEEQDTFYGSARDMTELQYINQDLPGGYYRATLRDGYEFLYISDTLLRMLGYSREEIRNRFDNRLEPMIHPEDRQRVRMESEEILAGNLQDVSPFRVLSRDGTYLYMIDQSRVTDQYGVPCWQSVMIDITEVMTLRNRMHLIEKYSTDCILFIKDLHRPENAEMACYGLEEFLGISQTEFERQFRNRKMRIRSRNGEELYHLLLGREKEFTALNGVYTIELEGGGGGKCHVRLNRIHGGEQDVDCIISFTATTGA